MKCRIDSKNLLNWSRMITTLTSVGDEEVHFAFTDSTLTLTVFNASLSGSGTCTFFRTFFHSFIMPRGYCKTFKLPAKCIMKPFRSTRFIKNCIFCEIAFEDDEDTIVITMGCKSLTEIKYTIQLLDNLEELHADADPDTLANWIRTDPKFMISNLNNFSHGKGLVDLTLKSQGNNLLMKNCATDLMRKENRIYTELTLSTLAFDRFAISDDTEVTFQLRDFKSFISLADHMKLSMTIHFQGAQDPVIVCVKSEQLEASLTLATKYVEQIEIGRIDNSSQASSVMSTGISNVSSDGPAMAPPPKMALPIKKITAKAKRTVAPTNYIKKNAISREDKDEQRNNNKDNKDNEVVIIAHSDSEEMFPATGNNKIPASVDDIPPPHSKRIYSQEILSASVNKIPASVNAIPASVDDDDVILPPPPSKRIYSEELFSASVNEIPSSVDNDIFPPPPLKRMRDLLDGPRPPPMTSAPAKRTVASSTNKKSASSRNSNDEKRNNNNNSPEVMIIPQSEEVFPGSVNIIPASVDDIPAPPPPSKRIYSQELFSASVNEMPASVVDDDIYLLDGPPRPPSMAPKATAKSTVASSTNKKSARSRDEEKRNNNNNESPEVIIIPNSEELLTGSVDDIIPPPPPPQKTMRDLLAKMNVPFDIYKKFPGHDIVLVEASDEEDDDEEEENTNYSSSYRS